MRNIKLNINKELYEEYEKACKTEKETPEKLLLYMADTIAARTSEEFKFAYNKVMGAAPGEEGWTNPSRLRIAKPRTKQITITVSNEVYENMMKVCEEWFAAFDDIFEDEIKDFCESASATGELNL